MVGDCLDVLAGRRAEFEAAILDPPAGVSFMGLKFDLDHGGSDKWVEHFASRFAACREACIPGAYGLFWALPRTQDWTMSALRKAGWHITDVVQHVFGQGWPKGKGQLKPAQEAWILCRDPRGKVRPLNIDASRVARGDPVICSKGGAKTYSGSPLETYQAGTGREYQHGGSWPTNFLVSHCQACVRAGERKVKGANQPGRERNVGTHRISGGPVSDPADYGVEIVAAFECLAACSCGLASLAPAGGFPTPCSCGEARWWACPVAMLDEQSGTLKSGDLLPGHSLSTNKALYANMTRGPAQKKYGGDSGGASRFYPQFHYDAKAARKERQAGCEHLLWVRDDAMPIGWRLVEHSEFQVAPEADRRSGNIHSTIKPIGADQNDGLMRWLVRLVTPDKGPVLDAMMGSGSTGVAAQLEGRDFFGCDIDPGAVAISQARLTFWAGKR